MSVTLSLILNLPYLCVGILGLPVWVLVFLFYLSHFKSQDFLFCLLWLVFMDASQFPCNFSSKLLCLLKSVIINKPRIKVSTKIDPVLEHPSKHGVCLFDVHFLRRRQHGAADQVFIEEAFQLFCSNLISKRLTILYPVTIRYMCLCHAFTSLSSN